MAVLKAGLSLDLAPLKSLATAAKQRAVTLKGVRAAAKIVQAAVKARAPKRKRSGALKQSIGQKSAKGKRGRTLAYAVVGARTKVVKSVPVGKGGRTITAKPAKYAHLVERGTKPHGGHPGAKPKPFLVPGLRATQAQASSAAMKAMADEVQKSLAKEQAKLARVGK
jgi:HK97 gp10 family phage protein